VTSINIPVSYNDIAAERLISLTVPATHQRKIAEAQTIALAPPYYLTVTFRVACPPKLLRTVMVCGLTGQEN